MPSKNAKGKSRLPPLKGHTSSVNCLVISDNVLYSGAGKISTHVFNLCRPRRILPRKSSAHDPRVSRNLRQGIMRYDYGSFPRPEAWGKWQVSIAVPSAALWSSVMSYSRGELPSLFVAAVTLPHTLQFVRPHHRGLGPARPELPPAA